MVSYIYDNYFEKENANGTPKLNLLRQPNCTARSTRPIMEIPFPLLRDALLFLCNLQDSVHDACQVANFKNLPHFTSLDFDAIWQTSSSLHRMGKCIIITGCLLFFHVTAPLILFRNDRKKSLKIDWVISKSLCMFSIFLSVTNNDIEIFSIYLYRDIENDTNFCLVRTVFSLTEILIPIKYMTVHFETIVRPWWHVWTVFFILVSLEKHGK